MLLPPCSPACDSYRIHSLSLGDSLTVSHAAVSVVAAVQSFPFFLSPLVALSRSIVG